MLKGLQNLKCYSENNNDNNHNFVGDGGDNSNRLLTDDKVKSMSQAINSYINQKLQSK